MYLRQFNYPIILVATAAILAVHQGNLAWFSLLKPLTTILIILAVVVNHRTLDGTEYRLLLLALLFCLVGDVLLLDEARFVGGLSAFLVAHLLFIGLFVRLDAWRWHWPILLVLTLLGVGYFSFLSPYLGRDWWPVLIYSVVISVMGWRGMGMALTLPSQTRFKLVMGVALFLFSDSVISLNRFVLPFDLSAVVILSSYWASLLLIVNVVLEIKDAR